LNDWAIKKFLLKENSEIQGGEMHSNIIFLNFLIVVLEHKTCSRKIFVDKVLRFIYKEKIKKKIKWILNLNDWAIKICLLKENSKIQGWKTPSDMVFLNFLIVILEHITCSMKFFVDKLIKCSDLYKKINKKLSGYLI
jgi:hypothetical protein